MQINIKPQNGDDAPWQRSGRERARARTSELAREREKERNMSKSNAPSMSNTEGKRYKTRIVSNILY